MPNYKSINVRKLTKALYLFLQKHHRTYGLSVIAWPKPPGNIYFSLYSLAVRDRNGYAKHIPDVSGKYCLTFYQDHISIPSWSATNEDQEYHPSSEKRELRTTEILHWLEQRLTLDEFFRYYSYDIYKWRLKYTVAESEPYLFIWNLIGLYAAKTGSEIITYGTIDTWGAPQYGESTVRLLGDINPCETVHQVNDIFFSTTGKVAVLDQEPVDYWDRFLHGESVQSLLKGLLSLP